jgi:hypothetical protein
MKPTKHYFKKGVKKKGIKGNVIEGEFVQRPLYSSMGLNLTVHGLFLVFSNRPGYICGNFPLPATDCGGYTQHKHDVDVFKAKEKWSQSDRCLL